MPQDTLFSCSHFEAKRVAVFESTRSFDRSPAELAEIWWGLRSPQKVIHTGSWWGQLASSFAKKPSQSQVEKATSCSLEIDHGDWLPLFGY